MVGSAVHSANTVKSSRKTRSDVDRQQTPSITVVVDTLESHEGSGIGTALKSVIMIGGIRNRVGENIRLSGGKAVA